MARTADFSAILNTKPEDIEDPKILPPGEYRAVVSERPTLDESAKKKTPYVRFTYSILEALESVDPDAIEAIGGIRKKDGSPRTMGRDDYYLTEDSLFRIKTLANSMWGEGNWENIAWVIENAQGQEVILTVAHRSYTPEGSTEEKTVAEIKQVVGTYNS